jgi:hypothetical protein
MYLAHQHVYSRFTQESLTYDAVAGLPAVFLTAAYTIQEDIFEGQATLSLSSPILENRESIALIRYSHLWDNGCGCRS